MLASLTSVFYTLIPHNFGRNIPPVINNQDTIDKKKELMITLADIELTQSLQKAAVSFFNNLWNIICGAYKRQSPLLGIGFSNNNLSCA